jgi:outer membrane lipoprotein carrier protein
MMNNLTLRPCYSSGWFCWLGYLVRLLRFVRFALVRAGVLAAVSVSALWASVALASPVLEQFEEFVQTVPAARGTFKQFTLGPNGQTSVAQEGEFAFERPGKFRWQTLRPFEQQVVSDGQMLYQFDPDLQQLTVRSIDQSIGSSPAAILFGTRNLQEAFAITTLPDQDGLMWLRATPRQPDAGLNQVDIGMGQGRPVRLLLRDGFGQTTQVDLLTLRAQSEFTAQEFQVDVPSDTDIVRIQ